MAGDERDERLGRRPAVAIVSPDPAGRGGMAAVVRGLLDSPLAQRYALTPIVTHRTGSVPRRVAVSLRGMAALARWCLRHPGGVVHVHSAVRGSLYRKAAAIALARLLRHPVVVQFHAGPGDIDAFAAPLSRRRLAALSWALHRAQLVLSVSEAGARSLRETFGLRQVDVIPNAVPRWPAEAPPLGEPLVLFLGGFEDPAKGGVELVAALERVLARQPAARIVLAGPGTPPPLPAGVEWRGWLDQAAKRAALEQATIVTLPSNSEGLPIVLLEAMGYGRALVATRVGGIPEIVSDGAEALLVDAGDVPALAEALLQLLADPARVAALGAAARARVVELGADDVVARLDRIYRELAARR
jgi:glycosyltransferase involved in cell wall biosynthesis